MTNEQKTYKIQSQELNKVIFIKALSVTEEEELWNKLAKSVEDQVIPFSTIEYKKKVVKALVVNFKEILKDFEDDEQLGILNHLYKSVITLLPNYNLDSICFHLNVNTNKKIKVESTSSLPSLDELYTNETNEEYTKEIDDLKVDLSHKNGIIKLEKYLKRKVIGQNEAIDVVMDTVKRHTTGLENHSCLFFLGLTGCGKSVTAKHLGKRYSGNFFEVDCGAYSERHDKATLMGAPPGFIGSGEKSILAEKAKISNRWVILFDEIEKAHSKFYDYLLKLMDDGVITDAQGNVLDFSQSIFIFSSNQGMQDVKTGKALGFGNKNYKFEEQKEIIEESLKNHFRPEFLNRIDEIVYFNKLKFEDIKKIVSIELSNYPVRRTKELVEFIATNGYSEEYGARHIKRFIKKNVATKIANALLDKKIPLNKGALYTMDIIEGNPVIINLIDFEDNALPAFE